MAGSKAKSVAEYLKLLPPEQRKSRAAVRKVVRENLPRGYKEAIGWGSITYAIPLKDYPNTYNGQPIAKVTPQKYIERYEASRGIR